MKDYKVTENRAVKELISWKKGMRAEFPEREIKSHLRLFKGGVAEKEHQRVAIQTIALKCLGKLSKTDVQEIDQSLERIISRDKETC